MSYHERVEKKRKLIAKHQQELKELLDGCPHEEMINRQFIDRGSYLNKGYIDSWRECVTCLKKFDSKQEELDYYG